MGDYSIECAAFAAAGPLDPTCLVTGLIYLETGLVLVSTEHCACLMGCSVPIRLTSTRV